MKLIPMAGLEIIYYKGHVIEWIEHLESYRVSQKEHPECACFYADNVREAQEVIDDNI